MAPSWIDRHFEISVKINFIHHYKVFPKYIQLFQLVGNCKIHVWRRFNFMCQKKTVVVLVQERKLSFWIIQPFSSLKKMVLYILNQGSAFLAHFGSFGSFFLWYGSFYSRRWFFRYENNSWNHRNQSIHFKFNQNIHEIWLFIILC
jgi:hypothetical protein